MQKSLEDATEAIADGLNQLHEGKRKSLLELIKRQASEIERRGQIIQRLESSLEMQKNNIIKLLEQNKHLEVMLTSIREERIKLLEEIKDLKSQKQKRTRKTKEKAGDDTKAA